MIGGPAHGTAKALCPPRQLPVGADVAQQHGELLAAPARQAVSRLEAGSEPVRKADQDGVADRVAVGVVDLLEVVGVEQQQAAPAGVRLERLRRDLDEVAPVEGARELVGAGTQLGLGASALELAVGVLHLAHAPAQVVLEPAPLGDVGDDAAHLVGAVQAPANGAAVVHPARDPVGADRRRYMTSASSPRPSAWLNAS